jgi:hypothetical protein
MTMHTMPRLMTLFKGSVPKHAEFPEANEDKLRTCDLRQRYVLSDGASESYNSSLWATIIVEAWFASPPRRNAFHWRRWLKNAIAEYESRSDRATMSWSQEAAFERGSFASLLVVEVGEDTELAVTAIGDSIAMLIADGQVAWSFPYVSADQFATRPHLLSTIARKSLAAAKAIRANKKADACFASVSWREGKGDRLLCMTDALGEWVLRECEDHADRLNRILNVASVDALAELVDHERAAGTMRRDDSSLVILGDASHDTANA